MATKQAVVNVKVNTPKTLGQLENELEQINAELKDLDVNSKAFDVAAKKAQKLDGEIKDLSTSLEGLSFEDKAGAIGDAAAGITGAFSLATQAAGLFGEEAEEGFGKAEAQALQFVQAMEGIENVTKLFRSETIKTFKSFGSGILKSIKSMRLFGLSGAASMALATAGITVLIALILKMVENWDAVTQSVKDFADSIPFLQDFIKWIERIWERIGSLGNLISALGAGIKGVFTAGTSFVKEFNKALEDGKGMIALNKELEKALGLINALEESSKRFDIFNEQSLKFSKAFTDAMQERRTIGLAIQKLEEGSIAFQKKRLEQIENERDIAKLIQGTLVDRIKLNDDLAEGLFNQQFTIEKSYKAWVRLTKRSAEFTREVEKQVKLGLTKEQAEIVALENLQKETEEYKAFVEINQKVLDLVNQQNDNYDVITEQVKSINAGEIERRAIIAEIVRLTEAQRALQEWMLKNEAAQLNALNLHLRNTKEELEYREDINKEQEKQLKTALKIINAGTDLGRRVQKIINNSKIVNIGFAQWDASVRKTAGVIEKEMNAALFDTGEQLSNGLDALEIYEGKMAFIAEKIAFFGDQTMQLLQAPITFLEGRIEKYNQELDDLIDKEDDAANNLVELYDLLKDAQGDRHDELLAQIALEEKAQNDSLESQLVIQDKIVKAEERKAKFEKAQAITAALIATALSVVQALPNIPLSVIVGAIGLANVAAIASQPLPQYSEGGFTPEGDKHEVKGVVHGSEYVVPTDVMQTALGAEMVGILEGMRGSMRGFAEGGFTSTPEPSVAGATNVRTLGNQPMFVAVTEIRDVMNNVDVIETKSSI